MAQRRSQEQLIVDELGAIYEKLTKVCERMERTGIGDVRVPLTRNGSAQTRLLYKTQDLQAVVLDVWENATEAKEGTL